MSKRVAIIGAGPSGLPAIRHAVLYGCEPVCFEATDKIGGLWNYKPSDVEEASVMKSTVINSSKEMTAYSDYPPPADFANYMHNRKLLEYFCSYAKHYDLERYVRFNHRVFNVKRSEKHAEDGTWVVEFKDEDGKKKAEIFDGVLVCTGHHVKPQWPNKWPGQDSFKGRLIHSHDYKEPHGFEEQVIVAVGIGNSGGDVAVELSHVAKQVYLSTRRGSWICSRLFDGGAPADVSTNTRFAKATTFRLPRSLLSRIFEAKLNKKFDHAKYGLKPKHDVFGAHLTTNDDIPVRIAAGTIIVKPNIESFTETDVRFTDGTVVKNVDSVICSTGYEIGFPMLEDGNFIKVENNYVQLYKFMYPLEQQHHSLAVLGLVQPLGSIMPIAEMQARVFLAVLTGSASLPSNSEMRLDVDRKLTAMRKQFYGSPRHTIQCTYLDMMDELSTIIGCRPEFWTTFWTDPVLAVKQTFGPCAPYVYRTTGPHKWEGAREAILGIPARIQSGFNQGKAYQNNCQSCAIKSYLPYIIVIILIAYFII